MRAVTSLWRFCYSAAAVILIPALPVACMAQEQVLLTLTVVSGNDAVNDISRYVPTPAVVEVRDESERPVGGARVEFTLPENGPGGRFADGARSRVETTDTRGRAILTGFVPNRLEGSFQILVSAAVGPRTGNATIRQTNGFFVRDNPPAQSRHSGATKVLIILGVGAAVALGGILAIKSGGGSGGASAATSTTVTVGPISVGAPH